MRFFIDKSRFSRIIRLVKKLGERMKYFIGLDVGTSAVKGALMSEDGSIIKVTDKKFEYI